MPEANSRLDRVLEDLLGNEALLGMLETEAAKEMLKWGMATATSIVSRVGELDDFAAELMLGPRLKAIRQAMRAIGNWAVGKYVDPESRVKLRERLLRHFRTIFGDERPLPSAEQLDDVLNQVDDRSNTPQQLVLKLRQLIEEPT